MALALVGNGSGWAVQQRYVTGGVDYVVAGRFAANGSAVSQNLALISDRSGSTLAAMKADGSQESQTAYFSRNPFGLMEGTSGTGGTTSTGTGYTGASTPNATGGFTYLRNRWYDPQTGRFLTQDPIGLAGGVNLYSYAGSNPVAFSDPFGLQQVRTPFGDFARPGPQGYAGFVGPGYAAHERLQHDVPRAASILVGLVPGVGDAVDVLGAAVGADLITGEGMSPAGRGATVVGTILGSGRLAREGLDATRTAVVIGENMKDRVIPYAVRTGAEHFTPVGTVTTKELFGQNMSWLRGAMREGHHIVDIGIDQGRAVRSAFYKAERELIERRGYPLFQITTP